MDSRSLRSFLALFALAGGPGAAAPVFGQSGPVPGLNNDEIIRLVKGGLGEDTIVLKIESSKGTFDTSTDAIIRLKAAGVPEAVIRAMLAPGAPKSPAREGAGLFLKDGERLARMDPTIYFTKIGAIFLTGAHARMGARIAQPKFVFSFADGLAQLAFAGPNEFLLVRLDGKEDSREVGVGVKGLGDKTLLLKVTDLGDRRYEVTPDKPLAPGEYGFFHMLTGRVFDFSVTAGR